MKRREIIALVGGAAIWPLGALAQPATIPVIGYLTARSEAEFASSIAGFRQGLREAGFIDGENVKVETRFAENNYARVTGLAADLVDRQVSVIAADGFPAAVAAKAATATIPVVFYVAGDAVRAGLVASLNRPGSNLTGIANLSVELVPKWLDLMHQVVPAATSIALLVNPGNPNADGARQDFETAAGKLGLSRQVLKAQNDNEIVAAFESLRRLQVGGVLISPDALFVSHIEKLAALSSGHTMPAIFGNREFAAAGGLMSYGASVADAQRVVGQYTGRILKGEKPADLPVQQPTKFELVLNVKAARALGLNVPPSLLATADEVIE
jgi:ABC-type uncharacterized transport system substrate-binding protein